MEEPANSGVPTRLGRYELVMKIATGGMATVYLGRMLSKGAFTKSVAIKVLHPELARDPGFVAMFLDEARLSAQIHHPNVVDVYDVDAEAGHLFIVMEYVEGASLFDLIRVCRQQKKVMPRPVALRILVDALAGLHAAHGLADGKGRALEIVHRDVSPQNLLVSTDGVTRVSDFGVAKSAGRLATTGTNDMVKGKLRYLSPEQMQRGELDRRVDVFAAGIILWEALTWRPLFAGDTHAETLAAVLTQPIVAPSKYATNLTPAIDRVCLRALERDRNQRFASAGEFAEALEQAAASEMASQKAVGRFVAEIARPNIERSRSAMHSNHDLSEVSQEEVAALTPSGARPLRKLTPLGVPVAPRPGAPHRRSKEPPPPAARGDVDDAPTKLRPPPDAPTDDDEPATRIAGAKPPVPRVSGPSSDDVATRIGPPPRRPPVAIAADAASAAGAQDEAPTRIARSDVPDEVPTRVASASSPSSPGLEVGGASSFAAVEPLEGDGEAPTRVVSDDAATRIRGATSRGTQPILAPYVDDAGGPSPSPGEVPDAAWLGGPPSSVGARADGASDVARPDVPSESDGPQWVPTDASAEAPDDARRRRTRTVAIAAIGAIGLLGLSAWALSGGKGGSSKSDVANASSSSAPPSLAASAPPLIGKTPAAPPSSGQATSADTAAPGPSATEAPPATSSSEGPEPSATGAHPTGSGKPSTPLGSGKKPGTGRPGKPPPTYVP